MRRCERESEIQGQSLRPCRAWSFRFAQGCPRKIYGRPRDRKSPSQFRLGRAWPGHSTPRRGQYKDVDARIKSAQDDFKSFLGNLMQVTLAGKIFLGQSCAFVGMARRSGNSLRFWD